RWLHVPTQPIWIGDVVEALLWAIRLDPAQEGTFDIGGPEVVSYADLMRAYARRRGLKRWMIPVPFLTPRLSSLWLALVTPVYARVGRALIDGIRHPTVVRVGAAPVGLPVQPVGVEEAIARTLAEEEEERRHPRWADGTWLSAGAPADDTERLGNRLLDARTATSAVDPARLFAAVERIGGRSGWHAGAFLWRLRGWMDLLAGGVGMRRGRRDSERLAVGDVVDCWRVEELERGRRLLLRAEMKLPGRAWLEFVVEPGPGGRGAVLIQRAIFDPLGLAGLAYWRLLGPLHHHVFAGMLRGLVRSAEA
ncbi:MAG TPA: DUF2867 domain-containing protein, partial [Planctomycetota bacterium]|nr:DUF2867 domain-containing protein [Planctomycetota bacterium]